MGPRQFQESLFSALLPWSTPHLSDKNPLPGGVGEGLSGGWRYIFTFPNIHTAGRKCRNLPAWHLDGHQQEATRNLA